MGDHIRLRVDLLGNKEIYIKSSKTVLVEWILKLEKEINIGWNSVDCRALRPKIIILKLLIKIRANLTLISCCLNLAILFLLSLYKNKTLTLNRRINEKIK